MWIDNCTSNSGAIHSSPQLQRYHTFMKGANSFRLGLTAWGMLISGIAPATILIFDPPSSLDTYGDRAVAESMPDAGHYFEGFGWTPNIVTQFSSVNPFTYGYLGELHLWLGGGSYGDIYPGLWADGGTVAQTYLAADEGHEVLLHEFHMGGWPSTDRPMVYCRVTNGSFGTLWDSGATEANPFIVAGNGHTTFHFDPPIRASIIRIHWGMRDDIGGGRISFSQDPPPLASILGHVDLQDFVGPNEAEGVSVEIFEPGNPDPVESAGVQLNTNGDFALPTSQSTGVYDIAVKGSHWLRKLNTSISLTSGSATSVSWTLINGDVDNDNEVSIGDYALLSVAYNSFVGDPNWVAGADLNGDEGVDIADYAILSQNYGLLGD